MIVEAIFENGNPKVYTKTLHQYDKDVTLMILGIELPTDYYVHFSNDEHYGMAVSCKGDPEGVSIPDGLFIAGEFIYAWLRADNSTKYKIVIPVEKKPIAIPVIRGGSEGSGFVYNEDEHAIEWTTPK